jgi:acyl carrier protein
VRHGLEQKVLEVIQSELNIDVTPESTIESLGVDSLELLELIQSIEAATGKQIPDAEFASIEKVSDIIRVVNA